MTNPLCGRDGPSGHEVASARFAPDAIAEPTVRAYQTALPRGRHVHRASAAVESPGGWETAARILCGHRGSRAFALGWRNSPTARSPDATTAWKPVRPRCSYVPRCCDPAAAADVRPPALQRAADRRGPLAAPCWHRYPVVRPLLTARRRGPATSRPTLRRCCASWPARCGVPGDGADGEPVNRSCPTASGWRSPGHRYPRSARPPSGWGNGPCESRPTARRLARKRCSTKRSPTRSKLPGSTGWSVCSAPSSMRTGSPLRCSKLGRCAGARRRRTRLALPAHRHTSDPGELFGRREGRLRDHRVVPDDPARNRQRPAVFAIPAAARKTSTGAPGAHWRNGVRWALSTTNGFAGRDLDPSSHRPAGSRASTLRCSGLRSPVSNCVAQSAAPDRPARPVTPARPGAAAMAANAHA